MAISIYLGYAVVLGRVLEKPALLDFSDIADKDLVPGLQNLMKYDPISFAILGSEKVSKTVHTQWSGYFLNIQTSMSLDGRAKSSRRSRS